MAPRKRTPSGSHQKCWLWGRHVVMETLRAGRWPVMELHLADDLADEDRQAARALADAHHVPVAIEPADRLRRLCHSKAHQGYLAKMAEYAYAAPDAVLADRAPDALYVLLDGIQDPHNLGAIVRSAEVFGAEAVFLPEKGQVGVTTAVARASAGAVNRIDIARVADPAALVGRLRAEGIAVIGASEKADTAAADTDLTGPVALVIGNESTGIADAVRARCTALARIPQHGAINSLNAAAAAAVLLYEARRQRER